MTSPIGIPRCPAVPLITAARWAPSLAGEGRLPRFARPRVPAADGDLRPPASGPAPPAGSGPPRPPGHRDAAPGWAGLGRVRRRKWGPSRPAAPGSQARPSPRGSASPCPRRAPPAGGRHPPRPSGPRRAGASSRRHRAALGRSQPGGAAWGPGRAGVTGRDRGSGPGAKVRSSSDRAGNRPGPRGAPPQRDSCHWL